MKKFTARNTFHNSNATFLAPETCTTVTEAMEWLADMCNSNGNAGRKARNVHARLSKKLCGIDGCQCGGVR